MVAKRYKHTEGTLYQRHHNVCCITATHIFLLMIMGEGECSFAAVCCQKCAPRPGPAAHVAEKRSRTTTRASAKPSSRANMIRPTHKPWRAKPGCGCDPRPRLGSGFNSQTDHLRRWSNEPSYLYSGICRRRDDFAGIALNTRGLVRWAGFGPIFFRQHSGSGWV